MTYHRLLFLLSVTCCTFQFLRGQFEAITTIQDWALQQNVIQSINFTTLFFCYFECTKSIQCYSLNFYPSNGLCELNKATNQSNPHHFHQHGNAVHLEYRKRLDCADELCNVTAGLRCFIENNRRTCKDCKSSLGMEDRRIPDSALTASSSYGDNPVGPTKARLNNEKSWAPHPPLRQGQWLQVDLAKITAVTGVATQGQTINSYRKWISKYKISGSFNESSWLEYQENGAVKIFDGNFDPDAVVTNIFKEKIITRYIRLIAWEWVGFIQLRMELYGCLL